MYSMDTLTHINYSTKIKGSTLSNASSSHATWKNLSTSSSIISTQLNDNDSRTDVQFEHLIKDEDMHPLVAPKFLYKLTCSLRKNFALGCFKQVKLFRQLTLGIP